MLLTQAYAPEDVSAAVLITELATDLVNRDHHVDIITCAPNYPAGRVFPGYKNCPYRTEWVDGVRVSRTWSYISPYKTFWRRIFNYGTFSLTACLVGMLADKPDLILSFSPPLPLGISAFLLSRWWRTPWVVQINDIYPEAAVRMGILHNSIAIDFFSVVERFIYRKATHITVISDYFRQNLIDKRIPPDKITVIPLWADPDIIRPLPKENAFRLRYGLNGRFVVMYAGNIGYTSNLEDVMHAAEILVDNKDVTFIIIGEGVKKNELVKFAEKRKLNNVTFLPFQPRDSLSEMLAAADLSLVTLNNHSHQTSLPSKIFNIMASERPILAVSPTGSEIAIILEKNGCGMNIPPNHPEKLSQLILQLKSQPKHLRAMGKNGHRLIKTKFARSTCVAKYEHMLIGTLNCR